MRYLAGVLIVCLGFQSCQHRQEQNSFVLSEGTGIAAICEIGQKPSSVRKSISIKSVKTTFREQGVGRVKEYSNNRIVLDTLDTGEGESVVRVSMLCYSELGEAPNSQSGVQHVKTKMGLTLSPTAPTRESVLAIYGQPVRNYKSHQDPSILDDIRKGVSYLITQESDVPEYLHYPGIGVAFVLRDGIVVKCSLEKPRARTIWRY